MSNLKRLPTRSEWVVVASLLATTPAFYIQMLEALPQVWAVVVYGGAAMALALLGHGKRLARGGARLPWSYFDAVLVLGLVAAAALPASHASSAALTVRMVVAGMSLWRLVLFAKPWVTPGSLRHGLLLALVIFLSCGLGFWLLEPKVQTLGDALWLAFTTAATVGYGDVVPSTPASKVFAVFVVLLGYTTLSLVTAAIAAAWVQTTERQMERDILRELHAEVKQLRAELAALRTERQQQLPPPPA